MGGILDFLRMAVPGAAAARTGYMQGQDQEQDKQRELDRQGVLDRLKQAMDQSTIDENHARADYYRNGGAGADGVTYVKDGTGNFVGLPKHVRSQSGMNSSASTGSSAGSSAESDDEAYGVAPGDDAQPAASSAGSASPKSPASSAPSTSLGIPTGVTAPPAKVPVPRTPAPPRISKSGVVNPASGMVEDVFSDGSRKEVRKATPEELAKVNRVPGSGTGAAGGARPMNPKLTEAYLQSIADRALQASGGDVQKAEFAVANDPNGQQAYSRGLATRHFQSAKARFDRQTAIDMDVHPTMDTTNAKGPPPKPGAAPAKSGGLISTLKTAVGSPPPNYRGAQAPTGKAGDISLGDNGGAPGAATTADGAKTPKNVASPATGDKANAEAKAAIVIDRIEKSKGAITPQQALNSKSLNDDVKALVRVHYGLPPT